MNLFKAPMTTPDFSLHAKFHGLLNLKRFTASSIHISKSSQTLYLIYQLPVPKPHSKPPDYSGSLQASAQLIFMTLQDGYLALTTRQP